MTITAEPSPAPVRAPRLRLMRYEPLPTWPSAPPGIETGPEIAAGPDADPVGSGTASLDPRQVTHRHPADASPGAGVTHQPTSATGLRHPADDRLRHTTGDRPTDGALPPRTDDRLRRTTGDTLTDGPLPPCADDRLRQSAENILRLLLEVLDGRRPLVQLAPHLAPSALRYVRAADRSGRGPSRLTSLRVCRPKTSAAEVAAVYRADGRARAVAVRLEQRRDAPGTWRCAAIRLG